MDAKDRDPRLDHLHRLAQAMDVFTCRVLAKAGELLDPEHPEHQRYAALIQEQPERLLADLVRGGLGDLYSLLGRQDQAQALQEESSGAIDWGQECGWRMEELEHLASQDPLTGCLNRRIFLTMGETLLHQAHRYSHPLSLLILDLDHFKDINDTWGHPAGDKVLRGLTQTTRQALRESDVLGRLGGDEFAVILPETAHEEAHLAAERLRGTLGETPVPFGREHILYSVSLGLATLAPSDDSFDDLLRRADRALYQAKEAGRNRLASC